MNELFSKNYKVDGIDYDSSCGTTFNSDIGQWDVSRVTNMK
jgi:surface protein